MHQEIGMYFWVIRITCPFKIITGQQGGKNLCSVVITKKFDKHYIFTLASISHWQPTFVAEHQQICVVHNIKGHCEQFQLNLCQADWFGFIRPKIWIHLNRSDSLGMFAEEPAKSDLAHSLTVLPAGGEKWVLSHTSYLSLFFYTGKIFREWNLHRKTRKLRQITQ